MGFSKADGSGRGWLMSDEEFADFELELEYRLPKGGNSGIFLRGWPEGQPNSGQFVEIQLMDDDSPKYKDLAPIFRNGSIFGIAAPSPTPFAPAELWNTVQLRTQGQRLQVTFNGVQVVEANLADHAAKADKIPTLARASGRLGLQLWDGPVEFRKVRVRRLSPGTPPLSEKTIRHFGYYLWDHGPELVSEIAPYTNVVIDVSWLRRGTGIIEAGQKAGRPVIPVVIGEERAGAEERLFPIIEKYRSAIPAVYWADTGEVGYSREQVDGFGRALKQRFSGIQLWVSYFNASPNVPGFEIAEAVDVVILSGLTGDSPQSVRAKTDEVLPAWRQKAGGRPIVLGWLATRVLHPA